MAALHQRGVGGISGAEQVARSASAKQGEPKLRIKKIAPCHIVCFAVPPVIVPSAACHQGQNAQHAVRTPSQVGQSTTEVYGSYRQHLTYAEGLSQPFALLWA